MNRDANRDSCHCIRIWDRNNSTSHNRRDDCEGSAAHAVAAGLLLFVLRVLLLELCVILADLLIHWYGDIIVIIVDYFVHCECIFGVSNILGMGNL